MKAILQLLALALVLLWASAAEAKCGRGILRGRRGDCEASAFRTRIVHREGGFRLFNRSAGSCAAGACQSK